MSKRILSGVAPAGVLFAPLLAVIMIPLDFGGSSVLVFASLKELLFAGAAGFGLMLASGDGMPQMAESESAWQQLSDLVAVLTDELGLERKSASEPTHVVLGTHSRTLAASSIEPMKQPECCVDGVPRICEQRRHRFGTAWNATWIACNKTHLGDNSIRWKIHCRW